MSESSAATALAFEEVDSAEALDWDSAVAGTIFGLTWAGVFVAIVT